MYLMYNPESCTDIMWLKVIYHPLYTMNNFVTNKSKSPQDGAQVFPYMRESHDSQSPHIWGDRLSCERHMIANHPI